MYTDYSFLTILIQSSTCLGPRSDSVCTMEKTGPRWMLVNFTSLLPRTLTGDPIQDKRKGSETVPPRYIDW